MPDSLMISPGAMTAGSPITLSSRIPLTAEPAISSLLPRARPMTEPTPTTPYDLGTNMKVKIEETFYQKLLETSDGQFQSGTFANAQVSSAGNNASLKLGFDLSKGLPVAAGGRHSLALLSDGTIKAWGWNREGQLGDGTSNNSSNTAVSVSGITNAVAVSSGDMHSLALLSDGTVKVWGYNGEGQLGDGTTISRLTPVTVSGITNAVAVSAGGYRYSLALLSDGTVKAWGV